MICTGKTTRQIIISFLIIITSVMILHADGTKTLIYGDGKDNRLNLVFLAEGYTLSEQTKFLSDVQTNVDSFLYCQPWADYKKYCNVYAIGTVSAESGADHPLQGITKSTYFEATFGNGVERLVTVKNFDKVYQILFEHVPDFDFVCLLVNDQQYGGSAVSGGGLAVVTVNVMSTNLILHETGHCFADLADEYQTTYSIVPQEMKNVTANTERSQIRWNAWIDPSTPVPTPVESTYIDKPGLFEGAMYQSSGWYRPKYMCTMGTFGDLVFCEICREEVIVGINNLVSLIETSFPSNTTTLENSAGAMLSVRPMRPDSHGLRTNWVVNGKTISATSDTLLLANVQLQDGLNNVVARVTDTTSKVRIASNLPFLTDSVSWKIQNSLSGIVSRQHDRLIPVLVNIAPLAYGYKLNYCLPRAQQVQITLRDLRGTTLYYIVKDALQSAGMHQTVLYDLHLGAGIYVMQLSTPDHTTSQLVKFIR